MKTKNHAVISDFLCSIRNAQRNNFFFNGNPFVVIQASQLFFHYIRGSETGLRFWGKIGKMSINCAISTAGVCM